jgi:hypothetical protein
MLPAILWFAAGLTLGLIVVGFIALGSYERGQEDARRERFRAELANRRIVGMSRRTGRPETTEERATA